MRSGLSASIWAAGAAGMALALSAAVLLALGAHPHGLRAALLVTGRLNFLLFWPAYTGSALAALFGRWFDAVRRRGRDLGLAFAAALLVHLGLVAWLCAAGDVPYARTFLFFGIAVAFAYLIALFSVPSLRLALGERGWWWLRAVGMNYLAYAFAVDFLDNPLGGGPKHVLAYLPFAVLAVLGPGVRLVAFVRNRMPRPAARAGGQPAP